MTNQELFATEVSERIFCKTRPLTRPSIHPPDRISKRLRKASSRVKSPVALRAIVQLTNNTQQAANVQAIKEQMIQAEASELYVLRSRDCSQPVNSPPAITLRGNVTLAGAGRKKSVSKKGTVIPAADDKSQTDEALNRFFNHSHCVKPTPIPMSNPM